MVFYKGIFNGLKNSGFKFLINYFTFLFYFLLGAVNFSIAQSTSSRPNILIILCDDMSWKMPDLNNADTFIHTTNIDRIANEGARFKYYSTNSLCVPGRTSLLTGNYGHKTGAMSNDNYPSQSLSTIPKILHANGYYTALCGKWMLGNPTPKPEFDYWLWAPNATSYYNDTAKYFNSSIAVTEHMTDFLTDSALLLISRIDTPFFLMLNYNAPHSPYIPQVQYDSLYNTNSFQIPMNWNPFTANYPSFLYGQGSNSFVGVQDYQHEKRNYFELMHGVEVATGKILDSLQSNGLLDNTLLIFTSDNGFLLGEHRIRGKSNPYDECMRLPLFIRFPEWFQAGTVVDSSVTLNIDIAPTILEAVGIPDTFSMEGVSVHSVFTNQFKRTKFLYEQSGNDADSSSAERTFRDNYFQYNRYYCSDTTEELFDMIADPFQNTNLVHHYLYQDTLAIYRLKLDSIRLAENDTAQLQSIYCALVNPVYTFEPPTLSATHVNGSCGFANGSIDITVSGGTAPFYFLWNTGDTSEDLNSIHQGTYHVTVTDFHGNVEVLSIYIGNTNGPSLNQAHVNATYSNANGSINLIVNGGTQPLSYLWSNGATIQDIQNLFPGNYSVTVTDFYGCSNSLSINIVSIYHDPTNTDENNSPFDSTGSEPPTSIFINTELSNQIFLFPNPADDEINISTSVLKGECRIELFNGYGIKLKSTNMRFDNSKLHSIDLNDFPSGIYFVRIHNGENDFIKTFSIVK